MGKTLELELEQRVNELKQAEEEVVSLRKTNEQLREAEKELCVRNEIVEIFLTASDEDVYVKVLRVVLGLLRSKYGVLGHIDHNGDKVCSLLSRDVFDNWQAPGNIMIFPRKTWGGIWGKALKERRSVYSNEPGNVLLGHIPVTKVLVVPIIYKNEVVGIFEIANKDSAYNHNDQILLQKIAAYSAPLLFFRLQKQRQEIEREKSEELVKNLNNFYENILDGIINGVWVSNREDVITYANKGMCNIAGVSQKNIVGNCLATDFSDETIDFFKPYYKKAKQTLQPIYYESIPTVTPAGRESYQSGWLIPRVKDNAFDGMICTVEDVTEKRRVQETLRETEQQYFSLVENVRFGVTMIDDEYNIIMTNSAVGNLFNKAAHWFVGEKCFKQFKGRDTVCTDCPGMEAMSGWGAGEIETEYVRDDGTCFSARVRVFPSIAPDGRLKGFVEVVENISEHKQIQKELQIERTKAQKFFDVAFVMLVVINPDQTVSHINKKACEILGYEEKEVVGKNWFDNFIPENMREWAKGVFENLVAGEIESADYCENVVVTKDGRKRILECYSTVIRDEDSRIVAVLCSGEDVTEVKKAEEKINHLVKFSSEDPNPVMRIKDDGTVQFANQASLPILNELKSQTGKVTLSEWEQLIKDSYVSQKVKEVELELLEHNFLITIMPFVDTGYVYVYGRDITEVKRAEQCLERKQQFQSVLNAMLKISLQSCSLVEMLDQILERIVSVPWLTLEGTGAILLVEAEPDTLVLRSCRKLPDAVKTMCKKVPFGKCLCGRAAAQKELIFADSLDERHEVRYEGIRPHGHYCIPILSAGEVLGVLDLSIRDGHVRDEEDEEFLLAIANGLAGIIQRKRSEIQLVRYRQQLEKLAKEDMGELSDVNKLIEVEISERTQLEVKLQESTIKLERFNAELEQFVGIASHDLQEPLRMVMSYLQRLSKHCRNQLDAEADELITYAVVGIARMKTLINALLAYLRIDIHGDPTDKVDCSVVINQILTNMHRVIEGAGALITYGDLPTVRGNVYQLGQLFQNLIENAIKFRGKAPVLVNVGAKRKDNYWVFSVSDNGPGIEPKFFNHIFLIFQRLHGGSDYPGTGIGLAICKKIVERHGGRIWVESEPGQGAVFYFTIPVKT